jgi:ATPase subunit of ABC transporter with duplicated ATPase domains
MEKRIERLSQTERPKETRKLRASFRQREFRGDEVHGMDGLSKSFDGRKLFSMPEITVGGGERVALIGDNGTGKSTLIRLIMGEEEPDSGWVRRGPSVRAAYLPQIVKFSEPSRSALDTLIYDCRCTPQQARDSLGAFGFSGEDALKAVGTLSGGEQSRLRLCMLMRGDINLLILDEPTNHLDIVSREWMEDALEGYGEALLFVSHDRYFIEKFATRIWALENGSITDFRGGFAEFREYRERRDAIAQASKKAAPRESRDVRKKGVSEAEKLRRKAEREIEKTEARLRELDALAEEFSSDYEKLIEIGSEREQLDKTLDALYLEWESMDEE